jgi:hypothetical protein
MRFNTDARERLAILEEVLRVLRVEGWQRGPAVFKGTPGDAEPVGPMCILNAFGKSRRTHYGRADYSTPEGAESYAHAFAVEWESQCMISNAIGWDRNSSLHHWNDARDRTFEDVEDALLRAIGSCRAELGVPA